MIVKLYALLTSVLEGQQKITRSDTPHRFTYSTFSSMLQGCLRDQLQADVSLCCPCSELTEAADSSGVEIRIPVSQASRMP